LPAKVLPLIIVLAPIAGLGIVSLAGGALPVAAAVVVVSVVVAALPVAIALAVAPRAVKVALAEIMPTGVFVPGRVVVIVVAAAVIRAERGIALPEVIASEITPSVGFAAPVFVTAGAAASVITLIVALPVIATAIVAAAKVAT